MSLVGKLEDLKLPEILQLLSLSQKTGKLTLTRPDASGLIVLQAGRVVYATSNRPRPPLGALLMNRGLLDEATLNRALARQHRSREEEGIGGVLVRLGALAQSSLDRVVQEETASVIAELLSWQTGYFRFDKLELPASGRIDVDAADLFLANGVDAETMAMGVLNEAPVSDGAADVEVPEAAAEEQTSGLGSVEPRSEAAVAFTARLREIVEELRSPAFAGEITTAILRFAATVFSRGVLFFVRRDTITGMGSFGVGSAGESAEAQVRSIVLPRAEPSVLARVAIAKTAYRGALETTRWNHHVLNVLGGGVPGEVVAIPILVNNAAVAVLYGDDLPEHRQIAPTEGLELLCMVCGLILEKKSLERRVKASSPAPT
jgi:Domain of unknown function (DUF4388)